ncbi:MAG: cytosine permease, partial [Proteobacteria bacterium]|nr:cytosine permease [Pseudomonadota bacterium]
MSSQSLIEVRSIDFVPLEERHGKVWHLWPIWFAGDAHLATLATGALGIAMGINLFWSIVAIVGGCALGTFFMAFHAAQGPQLGLPQMIQSRPQFGHLGALLVWGVALVTYIGYNAFNQ